MKLHFNSVSPFVRKVRVFAMEIGIHDRIELVTEDFSPVSANPSLTTDNPLGKIPTLVLDNGSTLFDSRVICEYLDTLHEKQRLFPESGDVRWRALRIQALADGMLDALVLARYEMALRPQEVRWPAWIEGQMGKIWRGADALEAEAGKFGDTVDIGAIAVGCALGQIDFRFGDEGWRDTRPKLAEWWTRFSDRPSMKATQPVDSS